MTIRLGHDPETTPPHDAGAAFPVVICDLCGERIRHAWDGVWLMDSSSLHEPTDTAEIFFAHRDTRDDENHPVDRCHRRLEEKLRRERDLTLGWDELARFPVHLGEHMRQGREQLGPAVPLLLRDVWLLRWIAAGMPESALPGQPKAWHFRAGDAAKLADRLATVLPKKDYSEAVEDDLQYGVYFDEP